jgi:hypothetical protein
MYSNSDWMPYEWQSYKGAGEGTVSKTSVCPVRISIFMQTPTSPAKFLFRASSPRRSDEKHSQFSYPPVFLFHANVWQLEFSVSLTVHGRKELAVSTVPAELSSLIQSSGEKRHQIKESDENKAVFVNPSFSHSCNAYNRAISVPLPTYLIASELSRCTPSI